MLVKLFKWLCLLFIFVVVLAACGIFLGNMFLPTVAQKLVPKFTGYTMTIEDPYVNLWRGEINFKGISLTQENAFPKPREVIIHQAAVNIEMRSLLKRTKVLSNVTIDVENVTVARRIADAMSLDTLLGGLGKIRPDRIFESDGKEPSKSEQLKESVAEKSSGVEVQYMIRELVLRVDNIRAEVYMPGAETPIFVEAPLMLDRTFENVSDVKNTIKPVVTDIMKRSLGIMSKALTKSFAGNAVNLGKAVGDTGQSLLGSLFGGSTETTQDETEETESKDKEEESGGFLGLF